MRLKLLGGITGAMLIACTSLATATPAAAAPWGWHHGWGWGWPGAVAAGVVGGAIAAATAPLWAPGYYDYYPGYVYAPEPYVAGPPAAVSPGGSVAYCEARFRSYDPASGTYLGFDGLRHPCP